VLTAQVDRSACVKRNEMRTVLAANDVPPERAHSATYMAASNRPGEFRCVLVDLPRERDAGAPLPAAARAALGVDAGDAVRCVILHQEENYASSEDAP